MQQNHTLLEKFVEVMKIDVKEKIKNVSKTKVQQGHFVGLKNVGTLQIVRMLDISLLVETKLKNVTRHRIDIRTVSSYCIDTFKSFLAGLGQKKNVRCVLLYPNGQ